MSAIPALYSRGAYRLIEDVRRDGTKRSPSYQIVWYDRQARRNKYKSTRTTDLPKAELALDRFYSERERGEAICPCCNRPLEHVNTYTIEQAIIDYLAAKTDAQIASLSSVKPRLTHFMDFLDDTKLPELACDMVEETLIEEFRVWSQKQPVIVGKLENGKQRDRAPSTTEASVRQMRAVVNFAYKKKNCRFPANFSPLAPEKVDNTPRFRASIEEISAMFEYCLHPKRRGRKQWSERMFENCRKQRSALLRFLQISVATWCRPDAAHDLSLDAERHQWDRTGELISLNPKGRAQTKKRRPVLPAPNQIIPLLEETNGYFVPVASVRKAFEAMTKELGLYRERETGMKLIRRSMAQLARDRMGEANWVQGQMMLGHRKTSTSDLYALRKPEHMGLAIRTTEEIIDEIERAIPGAFTGNAPETNIGMES